MTTPEPLDEFPAGGVEIRGGDRPEDFMPEEGCCLPGCGCDDLAAGPGNDE
jgi:hypothetical protein